MFEAPDGGIRVDVRLEGETVWLSLNQIAELFGRDKSVVSRHLRNVFRSGELEHEGVVARIATTAADGKTYRVEHFNLDAILSVGYRVNSRRGTQFRIWATHTLRSHLLRGVTVHAERLVRASREELEATLDWLSRTLERHALVGDEGAAVLSLVRRYARSWRVLAAYDEDALPTAVPRGGAPPTLPTAAEVRAAVARLAESERGRGTGSELFGRETGSGLERVLGALAQSAGGDLAYPTAEHRAAHLLYFLVKDHVFVDGNKRIAALLFLEYLGRCGRLTDRRGARRFDDAALVALTLLLAESPPARKDTLVGLVVELLGEPDDP